MAAPHRISRVAFQLDLTQHSDPVAVQDRVGTFCSTRLAALVDDVIADTAPPHPEIVLDQVTLDLGAIPLRDLEETVSTRLRTALGDALRAAWATEPAPMTPKDAPHKDAQAALFEALEHLLRFGQRHWRDPTPGLGLSERMRRALEVDQQALIAVLARVWASQAARNRVLWQIDDKTGIAVLSAMGRDDLVGLGKHAWPKVSGGAERKAVWPVLLDHALARDPGASGSDPIPALARGTGLAAGQVPAWPFPPSDPAAA